VKAFIVDRYGKKGSRRMGEMPDPQLQEDDVLVQVHAAGVNPSSHSNRLTKPWLTLKADGQKARLSSR